MKVKLGKEIMLKNITFDEHFTPYNYSYCPDSDNWYEDTKEFMPEPKNQPKVVDNFVIDDILGHTFNSVDENKEQFENFIKYHFGIDTGEDDFSFSIKNIKTFPNKIDEDMGIAISMYYFGDILDFVSEIEQGKNSCRYIESSSGVKFFAWQKDDCKVRFAVQKYVMLENTFKDSFIFIYDCLVDKMQLVSVLKRTVNKYIELIKTSIKTYEKENCAKFTNVRQNSCLDKWLNIKDGTYGDWKAKKFITAGELEKFINKLKPKIIDKPINNIIITGNLFNCCNEITECNFDNIEKYCAELDEPVIIKIGEDIQLEIDFQEHSLAQIGVNSLKEGDFNSSFGYPWRDISSRFKKNIIGYKIKDIFITKTAQSSITWQVKRNFGDDMYNKINFVLDNNYKLVVDCNTDYMNIAEIKPKIDE